MEKWMMFWRSFHPALSKGSAGFLCLETVFKGAFKPVLFC